MSWRQPRIYQTEEKWRWLAPVAPGETFAAAIQRCPSQRVHMLFSVYGSFDEQQNLRNRELKDCDGIRYRLFRTCFFKELICPLGGFRKKCCSKGTLPPLLFSPLESYGRVPAICIRAKNNPGLPTIEKARMKVVPRIIGRLQMCSHAGCEGKWHRTVRPQSNQ